VVSMPGLPPGILLGGGKRRYTRLRLQCLWGVGDGAEMPREEAGKGAGQEKAVRLSTRRR